METNIFDNTAVAFAAKSNAELKKDKFLFSLMGNNSLVGVGAALTELATAIHFPISPIFKYSVYNHFCGGETFEECQKTVQHLAKYKVAAMLNYGVELKETEADFDKTIQQTLEAINFAGENETVNVICIKLTGFGQFALFEKIQDGEKLTLEEVAAFNRVKTRFETLCKAAKEKGVSLYVDAEESWIQNALDALVDEMMPKYNQEKAVIFNTFQFYRHDRLAYLKKSCENAEKNGFVLGAKIVRGAYMEKERKRAQEMGYPSPIHENKAAVDKDFNEGMLYCLHRLDKVSLCIASQSEESNLKAIQLILENNIDKNHPHILFSQLYGMGDNITFNLSNLGYNACKYLPYGPVKDVIPYLIRRAQENTSVSGQMSRELKLIKEEIKRRQN